MRLPPPLVRVAGRQVAVEDAGLASGFPVIVHHGGTRHLFPAAVRDARARGLRLISYDRPGQGMSTPQPGRVVADCAEDVQAEIRVFSDDPGRARAEFRVRSAEFARLSSSPAWWMDRWADRAGKDAAHSQEKADYLALVNRDGMRAVTKAGGKTGARHSIPGASTS